MPVRTERLEDHPMHAEHYSVPDEAARPSGSAERVVAAGTTVARTLETWAATGEREGESRAVHLPRLPVAGGGRPADELPPAAVDAARDGDELRGRGPVREAYRVAVEGALPLLLVRGRHAHPERREERYRRAGLHRGHSPRRRGAGRRPAHPARPGRDARVHAGRDQGHGQGPHARGPAWRGRRHRARQHLPSVPAARRGPRPGGRWAPRLQRLGRADAHRFRRIPGLLARQDAQHLREGRPVRLRLRRLLARLHAGADDEGAGGPRARTSRWSSTSARPPTPTASTTPSRCAARRGGRRGARRRTGARTRRSSGSCRAGSTRTCARESLERTVEIGFPGYAVGGLSVGESREEMLRDARAATAGMLPAGKPRYFMGIGDPVGILQVIALGVDMFDCVLPTRLARHGAALTPDGRLNLKNARYRRDFGPLGPGVLLRGVHRLQPGLPLAPRARERAARPPADHAAQRPLHRRAVPAGAGRDLGRPLRGVGRRPGSPGTSRHSARQLSAVSFSAAWTSRPSCSPCELNDRAHRTSRSADLRSCAQAES